MPTPGASSAWSRLRDPPAAARARRRRITIRAHPVFLREILGFKRDLVDLRHSVAPVRDILGPIIRGELGPLEGSMNAYFRGIGIGTQVLTVFGLLVYFGHKRYF
jgi:hypothetical protein